MTKQSTKPRCHHQFFLRAILPATMRQPATMMTTQPTGTVNQVPVLKAILQAKQGMTVKVAFPCWGQQQGHWLSRYSFPTKYCWSSNFGWCRSGHWGLWEEIGQSVMHSTQSHRWVLSLCLQGTCELHISDLHWAASTWWHLCCEAENYQPHCWAMQTLCTWWASMEETPCWEAWDIIVQVVRTKKDQPTPANIRKTAASRDGEAITYEPAYRSLNN